MTARTRSATSMRRPTSSPTAESSASGSTSAKRSTSISRRKPPRRWPATERSADHISRGARMNWEDAGDRRMDAAPSTKSSAGARTNQGIRFERGFPTPGATQRKRDEQDFERAVTAYRFWYPTVSQEGAFNGLGELGFKANRTFALLALGPRHVVFTGNSDTPYGFGAIDLNTGPFVI